MDYQGQIVALCDAVVGLISDAPAGTFCKDFKVERLFVPILDTTKISDEVARLDVIPGSDSESRVGGGAQGSFSGTYDVHLVLQQRVGAGPDAEAKIAQLMRLRGQLRDYFKRIAIEVDDETQQFRAVLEAVDAPAPYVLGRLIEQNCFFSEVILAFKVVL